MMKKMLTRVAFALALAVGLVLGGGALAAAAAPLAATIETDTGGTIGFVFSWVTVVQFVIQIGLPLVVAIVTTRVSAPRHRGILLAALTVVGTILNAVLQGLMGGDVELFGILIVALVGFVISVGFHFGLWGAAGPADPATGERTPSISATLTDEVGRTA
jgi:hypothetical protein